MKSFSATQKLDAEKIVITTPMPKTPKIEITKTCYKEITETAKYTREEIYKRTEEDSYDCSENGHEFDGGVCTHCGWECDHEDTEEIEDDNGGAITVCSDCGTTM